MTRRLTLRLDEDVIATAKRLAAENHTSVSAIFTSLIQDMTTRKKTDVPISPAIRKISGIVKLPMGKTYRDLLTEALMERHGMGK